MKKIMLTAALATLAACSPATTADEAAAPAAEADTVSVAAAADGGPSTGTFKITGADGKVAIEEVRADGTYTATAEGEPPKTGTWEQKSPDSFCTTADEEGSAQKCFAEAIGADGVWTSTDPDDGEVSTIERVVA